LADVDTFRYEVILGTRKSDAFIEERARIRAVLEKQVGDDYDSVADWQRELQEAVRLFVIKRIEPAINERLASMPQATLAEKQELCRWANTELRCMGLAVRCPKTGQPAFIYGDRGNHHSVGRFQIELSGRRRGHLRTLSKPSLFPLKLCCGLPTKARPQSTWSQRVAEENDLEIRR
jgi:hypothetical protein